MARKTAPRNLGEHPLHGLVRGIASSVLQMGAKLGDYFLSYAARQVQILHMIADNFLPIRHG